MIYKFILISDEVDNFMREINIDSDATFFELQNAILDAVEYTHDQMTSFFICDQRWEKEKEITLVDMGNSFEEDAWIMDETPLSDLIEDEGQKLLFVFDYIAERSFFIELIEVETGKSLAQPLCTRSQGASPQQTTSPEELDTKVSKAVITTDFSEEFYGDESYNSDELDMTGFEGLDMGEEPLPFDESQF